MDEDEELSMGQLKIAVNTFVWTHAPGDWTLSHAESVAVEMYDNLRESHDTWLNRRSVEKAYSKGHPDA